MMYNVRPGEGESRDRSLERASGDGVEDRLRLHSCQSLSSSLSLSLSLAKYAYLGAPNMAKWGAPEKILQKVVQTRWSEVNRTLQSKFMTKSNFWLISPL